MALPANIKKVYESDGEIVGWGDGTPTRDFIYAGDVASATIKCMEEKLHITSNLGSGEEISIKRMVDTIIKVSGKDINVTWDTSKPNGEPRRRMNTTIQEKYGLLPQTGFEEGIKRELITIIKKTTNGRTRIYTLFRCFKECQGDENIIGK